MSGFHTYLISSLPMLHLGMKPPFSFAAFIKLCEPFIERREGDALAKIDIAGNYPPAAKLPTLDRWYEFDRDLRNELVKIRASRKKTDPAKYLRPDDGYTEPYITHIALHAHRNPSLVESERILDEERWKKLDELECGHYFDFDYLIIYGLRLLILQRWERFRSADKKRLLDRALQRKEAN